MRSFACTHVVWNLKPELRLQRLALREPRCRSWRGSRLLAFSISTGRLRKNKMRNRWGCGCSHTREVRSNTLDARGETRYADRPRTAMTLWRAVQRFRGACGVGRVARALFSVDALRESGGNCDGRRASCVQLCCGINSKTVATSFHFPALPGLSAGETICAIPFFAASVFFFFPRCVHEARSLFSRLPRYSVARVPAESHAVAQKSRERGEEIGRSQTEPTTA